MIYVRFSTLILTVFFALAINAQPSLPSDKCPHIKSTLDFQSILACYRSQQAVLPLKYTSVSTSTVRGIEKRSYQLISQHWPPEQLAAPTLWTHGVNIAIPENAIPGRALLIINNGINRATESRPVMGSSDFSDDTSSAIAQQTRTIVITVSDVPNQYLSYQDSPIPKMEDDSVAHSWKLFLDAPEKRAFLSLHIPMMEAIVKAMDLAEKVLTPWNIHSFILTGASKRGWTAWHTALADTRVDAIVPFVIDILNTRKVLEHTYQSYGENWPIAFLPYYREGITEQRNTSMFAKLMDIEDPLRYLDSADVGRLSIPKYIVNASSDDFFLPDNARLYFDQLPGEKALRVAPNCDHRGIRAYTEEVLVSVINRLQQSISLPKITTQLHKDKATLLVHFSESPVEVTQWTAVNPLARDFRRACAVNYVGTSLRLNIADNITVVLPKPTVGWAATFVEARFADGFIATTPVYISPNSVYPIAAPPEKSPACRTLPGLN